eukprot:CAMPEP_0194449178 /NCGR_PEP_ID=MMETSP0176-20130528/129987_1 /TAXON_ID=216777 /ORGANISM="Proboscia alata, Strain PI-D3" /LENGTH=615 /DNA_ID=CAMNT_0039276257 /DNA_START=310 /DNA_END=2157 /DNA_ORIENTATION=-
MKKGYASMNSIQITRKVKPDQIRRRITPNQDVHTKVGFGSKSSGLNESWGNMKQKKKKLDTTGQGNVESQESEYANHVSGEIQQNGRSRVGSCYSSENFVQTYDKVVPMKKGYASMNSIQITRKIKPDQITRRITRKQDVHTKVGFGSKSSGLNESWGNMKRKIRALSSKNKSERSMSGCKSLEGSHNEHWDSAFVDGGFEIMKNRRASTGTNNFDREAKNSSGNNPLLLALADKTFQDGWDQYTGDKHKPLNLSAGKELIVRAMREGSMIARGFCLANGWGGLGKNNGLAFSIFLSLAVDKNDSNSMALTAYFYLNGDGVQRDSNKAMIWLFKAIELKNSFAQSLIGSCYRIGEGVQKDGQRAFELYKDSAEQGYVRAMYELGRMYEAGDIEMDIMPDVEEGLTWYRKACNQNHPESKQKMKEWAKLESNKEKCRTVLVIYNKEIASLGIKAKFLGKNVLEDLAGTFICKLDSIDILEDDDLLESKRESIQRAEAIISYCVVNSRIMPSNITNSVNSSKIDCLECVKSMKQSDQIKELETERDKDQVIIQRGKDRIKKLENSIQASDGRIAETMQGAINQVREVSISLQRSQLKVKEMTTSIRELETKHDEDDD